MYTELEKRNIKRLSNKESNRITKECIRSALIALMDELPYDKINMSMIIERSGASRASIYRNYSSKEEILLDITQALTDGLIESITGALRSPDASRNWLKNSFNQLLQDKEICILMQKSNIPFVNLLDDAIKEVLQDAYPTDKIYYVRGIIAGFLEIAMTWIKNGMHESPSEMANICISTFCVDLLY